MFKELYVHVRFWIPLAVCCFAPKNRVNDPHSCLYFPNIGIQATFILNPEFGHISQKKILINFCLITSFYLDSMQWMQSRCQWSSYNIVAFKHYRFHPWFLWIWNLWWRACHSRVEWSKYRIYLAFPYLEGNCITYIINFLPPTNTHKVTKQ